MLLLQLLTKLIFLYLIHVFKIQLIWYLFIELCNDISSNIIRDEDIKILNNKYALNAPFYRKEYRYKGCAALYIGDEEYNNSCHNFIIEAILSNELSLSNVNDNIKY